mmetsp:Transcript_479/g.1808  ORF Transcript_479/g.1808 Transcript_479/m.1808 type:complete len:223 (-) Transcript_479:487-1155(-)
MRARALPRLVPGPIAPAQPYPRAKAKRRVASAPPSAQRSRKSSAICTALVAAPLRTWSPARKNSRADPERTDWSFLILPTRMSSWLEARRGSGKALASRSSTMRTPGASAKAARALASRSGTSSSKARLTASQWARRTGTRTQVTAVRKSGSLKIFFVSTTILVSSSLYPVSRSTGALWEKRFQMYCLPKMSWVTFSLPSTQSRACCSSSAMAAAPAPDAAW